MEKVNVLVRVFERPGLTREATVQVSEEAFRSPNWRALAALFAANALELPFTFVAERAKFGLLPTDKERLREKYGRKDDGAHCAPLQTENGGKDDGAGD